MLRNDEDFFASVERIEGPLTGDDQEHLLAMLSSSPFLRLTKALLAEVDEMKNRLLSYNLGDEKERAAASKLQGEITAYPRLFGLMIDLALRKEELPDETRVVEKPARSSS